MRGHGDRFEAVLGERGLDRFLVTDLTNVRYLTGFTGTNGLLLFQDTNAASFPDRFYRAYWPLP